MMIAIVRFVVALTSADMPPARRISRRGAQEKRGSRVDGRRKCRRRPQRYSVKHRLAPA